MAALAERLQSLTSKIVKICEVSGTPGISVAVVHHNKLVLNWHHGVRDVATGEPVDENTIYHIMSNSKSITAAAAAILVNEGKLKFEQPIKEILPEVNHFNAQIRDETTLLDLLAQRTGLAGHNTLWMQEYGRLSLKKDQTIAMFNALHPVHDFRTKFLYSNWGPAMAALMIERVSGMSWGHFLSQRIFQPLQMNRTFTNRNPDVDNVAQGYMAVEDAGVVQNERPHVEDGQIMAGAGAVQTCTSDLVKYYSALLEAWKDQTRTGEASTIGLPFKLVPTLLTPHMHISDEKPIDKQGYTLGWVSTELPGTLGQIGINGMYVDRMPTAGRDGKPTRVWHHNGSLAAFLSSIHLLPDTDSIVVVLTNSIANNDAADWVGQMLVEEVIETPTKNDYVALAQDSAETCVRKWEKIPELLAQDRKPNTEPKDATAYAGKFFSSVGNWHMEIFMENDELRMCIQGDRRETYRLDHYQDDEFTFVLTERQNAERGRFPLTDPKLYVLKFQAVDDEIVALVWSQDPGIPEGELFLREGASIPSSNEVRQQFVWKRFIQESGRSD